MKKESKKYLSGCDYLCITEGCPCYQTKIVILEVCPLSKIEDVIAIYEDIIASKKFGEERSAPFKGLLEHLIDTKEEGRTHAISPVNFTNNLIIDGYRKEFFCPSCKIVWSEDVMGGIDEAEKRFPEITCCKKCNGVLINNEIAEKDGIICVSCGEKLRRIPWYSTNE